MEVPGARFLLRCGLGASLGGGRGLSVGAEARAEAGAGYRRCVRREGAAAVRERPRVSRRRAGLPAAVRRQLDLWKQLPENTWEMLRSTVGF